MTRVVAVAAGKRVIAGPAVERVVAGAAVDDVVTGSAVDDVVAGSAVDGVVATLAVKRVVAVAAVDKVVAVAAHDVVVAADAGDGVISNGADQRVVAVGADYVAQRAAAATTASGARAKCVRLGVQKARIGQEVSHKRRRRQKRAVERTGKAQIVAEIAAGAQGRDRIGAIRTRGDVDMIFLERGDDRLTRKGNVADQEGRYMQGAIDDDDFRSVRLDENQVRTLDTDVDDRGVGGEMRDVVFIGNDVDDVRRGLRSVCGLLIASGLR